MKGTLFCLLFGIPCLLFGQRRVDNSLNSEWTFAADPVKVGEKENWQAPSFPSDRIDKVTVPHCFSTDPRYFFYTGTAWYFKQFEAAAPGNDHVFLKFDAVFYKSKIWLNGTLVGTHEGGYTPFEFDITALLKTRNTLAVEVNNSWDTTTIPGAKTNVPYSSAAQRQVYPWINYGGITRPVHLITRPAAYISNSKIVAIPDLAKGNAEIRIKAFIRNNGTTAVTPAVNAGIYRNGAKSSIRFKPQKVKVEPGSVVPVELTGTLPAAEVTLWSPDAPALYTAAIMSGSDTIETTFGIRKVEVRGTQLLLNGEPIKMGGCNRPLDYPGYGSMDPEEVLEKDLPLIKSGGMELSRINHYPVTETLLDWADRHGLLIIEEAGNWQMTPKQMSDTMMRRKFRSQMREMMERDWNHPCVIAYSVGNEFQSQTEEGKAWVRDMSSFVKSLDDSRLITFASMMVGRDMIKKPEDEASQYVDFVSANIYGNHLKLLQHIHALYPSKPIYVSEFGIRTDAVKSEEDRVAYLKKAMQDFRQCSDYLIGASVWTFNDYFSRFPGTNANGYRPWGLVAPDRTPRGMYTAWQEEFAPATIELVSKDAGQATIRITARKDFPSYTLKGYRLKCNGAYIPVKTLHPGESMQLNIALAGGAADIALIKPGGFTIIQKTLK
ncbi:MAG TPA: glycoside hydrolase family 2 TIM barrel-domain containing protein [Chitinophaga sp.]|uniref:glycoside hydrolase family 2 protein n=1 Tax=Chitinophaga sp. TaxID=1869181 RepID=UPI002DBBD79F|nr:glycoside hydrolase family 2 TIM barrel-domain containing protein [Chitinophaga sp.]HEU4554596.1 glycoside hydrolase family 2 TIM barrel-domain containing protein [Chitinophaga sp.]